MISRKISAQHKTNQMKIEIALNEKFKGKYILKKIIIMFEKNETQKIVFHQTYRQGRGRQLLFTRGNPQSLNCLRELKQRITLLCAMFIFS